MKRLGKFETIVQIVFMIAFSFVVEIFGRGVEFDFTALKTVVFWLDVFLRLMATMIFFNLVFEMDQRNRRARTDGKYYAVMATYSIRVRRIYAERCFEKLDAAVAEENEAQRIISCNDLIHEATTRLSYDEIDWEHLDDEGIERTAKKYLLNARAARKLKKALYRIANGKVRYHAVKAEAILKDQELDKVQKITLDVDYKKMTAKRNLNKAATFLGTSVIISAVSGFSLTAPNFLVAFLMNATLFLGAVASALYSSVNYTKYRQGVFEARNRFFERRLGIKDEYGAKKPGE